MCLSDVCPWNAGEAYASALQSVYSYSSGKQRMQQNGQVDEKWQIEQGLVVSNMHPNKETGVGERCGRPGLLGTLRASCQGLSDPPSLSPIGSACTTTPQSALIGTHRKRPLSLLCGWYISDARQSALSTIICRSAFSAEGERGWMSGRWESVLPVHWPGSACTQVATSRAQLLSKPQVCQGEPS